MYYWHYVIGYIAALTTLVAESSVIGRYSDEYSKARRFLVPTSTSTTAAPFLFTPSVINFCSFCTTFCTNGYVLSSTGCMLCQCKNDVSSTQVPTTSSTSVRMSTLSQTTPSSTTSMRSTSTTLSTTSISTSSPRSTLSTISATITPPVSQTTISQNKQGLNFNDPCIPSQQSCDKDCNGEYVIGPGSCQYCLCASRIPPEFRTTVSPDTMTTSSVSTPLPHYLDLTPTSEACIMAKIVCSQLCTRGVIEQPDDCLFCSCQKPNDETLADSFTEEMFPLHI